MCHLLRCATTLHRYGIGKSIDSIWFTGGGVHFRINKSRPDTVDTNTFRSNFERQPSR